MPNIMPFTTAAVASHSTAMMIRAARPIPAQWNTVFMRFARIVAACLSLKFAVSDKHYAYVYERAAGTSAGSDILKQPSYPNNLVLHLKGEIG